MPRTRTLQIGAVILSILALFYLFCVHYTDMHQVAIVRNRITGSLWLDSVSGFNVSAPWVQVARIDTRPRRVCVVSAGRSFNCKLVRFVPSAFREFVATEGFRYYWWANRFSFNGGYSEEYRGMKDYLRGYAFSTNKYPFIKIEREYGDQ